MPISILNPQNTALISRAIRITTDMSARTLSHMNKDHQLALNDYILHYAKFPESLLDKSSIKMTDVNDKSFTVEFKDKAGSSYKRIIFYDLEPETASSKSIKDSLVTMAKVSARKRGYAHYQITKVSYPSFAILMWVLFVVLTFLSFNPELFKSLLGKSSLLVELGTYLPQPVWSFFGAVEKYANVISFTTYTIHILEILTIMLPQLKKYRVPFKASLVWVIMHFIEGYFTVVRFNKLKQ